MPGKEDHDHCRIVVTGDELAELKRHAHQIPECPGLERRIQRYTGRGRLVMSQDEVDWMVAVLDAVLSDPKGYACIEYHPFKLEYVPRSDDRCKACQRLYDRLEQEGERLFREGMRKPRRITTEQRLQREIESVFARRGVSPAVCPTGRGYEILDNEGQPVGLVRRRGERWEVLSWSRRQRWESIGVSGGQFFDTVQEAASYVLKDPLKVFRWSSPWHPQ